MLLKINEYSDVLVSSFNYTENFDELVNLLPDRVSTTSARWNYRTACGWSMVYAPECPICNYLILSALTGATLVISIDSDTTNLNIKGVVKRCVFNARTNEMLTLEIEFEGIDNTTEHITTEVFQKATARGHLDVVHSITGLTDYNFTIERGESRFVGTTYIPSLSHKVSAQLSLYLSPPLPNVHSTELSMYSISVGSRTFSIYGTVFYNVPLLMPKFADCIVQVNLTNGKMKYV